MINIDDRLSTILNTIEASGYKAAFVGGFVREGLRSFVSEDVDIASSAPLEKLKEMFEGMSKFDANQYGVKFKVDAYNIEITRMRSEVYETQSRYPDKILWTDSFEEDSVRRDFTVNALYFNPNEGVFDFHEGLKDLENETIRYIGDPEFRIKEDPLRMLRMFRFQSEHGFSIELLSLSVSINNKDLLSTIPSSHQKSELERIVMGYDFLQMATENPWVLGTLFQELNQTIGFNQNNPYHNLDLYQHIIHVVSACPYDLKMRLAALFHDIGKVNTCISHDNVCHYPGHAEVSKDLSLPIFERLGYGRKDIEWISRLIEYHGMHLEPVNAEFQMLIYKFGFEWVESLIALKRADNSAKSEKANYQIVRCDQFKRIVEDIKTKSLPVKLSDLEIRGNDLLEAGLDGHVIGRVLEDVFEAVVYQKVLNEKKQLLAYCVEVLV